MFSKNKLFFTSALILVWLTCDTVIYFYLQHLQAYRNIFYGVQIPDNSSMEHLKKTFHPDWGWDIKDSEKGVLGSRNAHWYSDKPIYKLKTFGDSYTFCVTNDKET